ncbi:response regulator receiver domain-containing protein [Primorskyibacter sedentarius]|uniref:Response regulator receiver domain-containing protein n=1 Tax=Primorskyibacter sedentarius TaxID=745311 RepID=A0A4R3J9V6_9RHOB|nr:response regulator [Primorskyibacter sedentarius]TCS62307.1 response regulator receiver domain-containing protein [Primorskyibacter sedentarius]
MKILIVEDDLVLCDVFSTFLRDAGHDVLEAHDINSAIDRLRGRGFDLVILDYYLPDGVSLPVAEYSCVVCPDARIILLTGSGVFPNGEAAILAPCIDWTLRKPVPLEDLRALVEYAALNQHRAAK